MQEEEPLPPERDQDQSEPDTTPPDPDTWTPEPFAHHHIHTHAPTARSGSSPNSAKILEDLAASKSGVDYAGVAEIEEAESNIQERSQGGRSKRGSITIRSVEPTPSRAPKHLSHDTVPSFGNLDASTFDAPKIDAESTPMVAARIPLPAEQTPNINVQVPTDTDASHHSGSKKDSRAPSRVSHAKIESVHETEDTDTVKDEADARTVPVETRAASQTASHKSRSIASHHPPERDGPLSATSIKSAKSRASIKSPPPQSVRSHVRSAASVHPSQMALPSSIDSTHDATPTQRTVPLHVSSNYAQSQHAPSSHAPSHHAPSHHAPSHHAPSQHAPSHRVPSKAPTITSLKTVSQHALSQHPPSQHAPSLHASSQHAPSQRAPSAQGSIPPREPTPSERRDPSLHPLSNHAGAYIGGGGTHYAGSKYAGSQQGGGGQSQVPSTPSLHPLTQHLQAHPPGSRSSSRFGRMQSPYNQTTTGEDLMHAVVRNRAISPTPSNPHGIPQDT
ncbi:hypothetical protein K439DRAFT_212784 [Ramaria rubella]|nr:hypothetical protein K439DRAFT_212784 [Ramaria rubella]